MHCKIIGYTDIKDFDQTAHLRISDVNISIKDPGGWGSVTVLGEKCRLVLLRCKGTATCFPAILAQRDNFCDFLFASLDKLALQNRDLLLQNRGPFVNLTLTGLGPFELKSF